MYFWICIISWALAFIYVGILKFQSDLVTFIELDENRRLSKRFWFYKYFYLLEVRKNFWHYDYEWRIEKYLTKDEFNKLKLV